MTPLSRWKLDKKDEEEINEFLIVELEKISSKKKMETLVKVLFSDTEKLMMAKRMFAFVLIDQGLEDMQIVRRLHVTRETAARLRRIYRHLDEINLPVKPLVKQISESETLKALMNKFLKYAIAAAGGKAPKTF